MAEMEAAPIQGTAQGAEMPFLAVPFDLKRMEVVGGPVSVIEGRRMPPGTSGAAQFAVAEAGTLVYVPGPQAFARFKLALVDRFSR